VLACSRSLKRVWELPAVLAAELRGEICDGTVDRDQTKAMSSAAARGTSALSNPVSTSARVMAVIAALAPTCSRYAVA
jgi:hypothetical protein